MTTTVDAVGLHRRAQAGQLGVVWGMLARDARVLRKQFPAFLARVMIQPLLLLFTFSYVLPSTTFGVGGTSFSTVMVPGIIGSTMVFAGIMGVTVPLISQMGFPREIDDRLLSPVPAWAIAVQKVCSGTWQALVAALMVLPVLIFLHAPGQAPVLHVTNWPLLLLIFFLASMLSACLGLVVGTLLDPSQFNVLFNVIMMPALMLGCVYFPWAALYRVPWLQIAVLVNPIVYLSEAFRAVLTPTIPHMSTPVCVAALAVGDVLALYLGVRSFLRRVRR